MGWIVRATGPRGRRQQQQQQSPQDADWQQRYAAYLASPEWQERRRLVLRRAGNRCEACLVQPAEEVHHLTYRHVGEEFLWELKAVCRACHKRLHPEKHQ
jgi:5-methylcytosine-specific restriction endonuclease McrA